MTFQPLVPFGGLAGWSVLQRTLDDQKAAFAQTGQGARDRADFRERIGTIDSAAALVSDFRLLRVALGAFGLQEDLPNKAFVRQVLASDPGDPQSLANRLSDRRYRAFAEAFGFGRPLPPQTGRPGFADRILAQYADRRFEAAVGAQNEGMRLALNLQRELPALAAEGLPDETQWLRVLGTPPLRAVFEGALGLPRSFGTLDLDRQIAGLRDGVARLTGSREVAQFTEPGRLDRLLEVYLIRADAARGGPAARSPGRIALSLLQGTV